MQYVRSRYSYAHRAVQDTFLSIKDVFERHNVVFTIGASLASAGAAWAGYTARQLHQRKVEERLDSIEHVMANVHHLEKEHVKAITQHVGVSYTACAATAGTTLIIGYGFGFRSGRRFAMKRFQKQQQKLTGGTNQRKSFLKNFNSLTLGYPQKTKTSISGLQPKAATPDSAPETKGLSPFE